MKSKQKGSTTENKRLLAQIKALESELRKVHQQSIIAERISKEISKLQAKLK